MEISVFLGLFTQSFQNYLGSMAIPMYFAILIVGYLGVFIFLFGGKSNSYTTSFGLLIVYFCLIGLFRGNLSNYTIAVTQDLRYVMYFLLGSIFAQNERYMAYFHSIMKKVGYVAIALGLYAIITFPFSTIEGREATWTDHYYFWWASASSFVYLGAYSLVTKKDRIIGLGTFAIFFVLGMLFLKRSAFINVIVLVLLSTMIQSSRPVKNIVYTLIGVVMFLFALQKIAPEYFLLTEDALFERFEEIDAVSEVNRNVEAQMFFERISISDIIWGFGIFNYPEMLIPNKTLNALHNGWANIIFKGGVIYALWYILLYGRIFKNMIHIKQTNILFHVCIVVAISALFSLLYEGSWTYTILPFCISAPIFYSAKNTFKQ